jgi:hypothetical protein
MLSGVQTTSLVDLLIAKLYHLKPEQDDFQNIANELRAIEEANLSWVNTKSIFGHTIAHICAFKNLSNILSGLITYCAGRVKLDLSATHFDENSSPLHFACAKGFLEVTQVILQHDKTRINALDAHGLTPLHLAYSILGNPPNKNALIDLLVGSGANPRLRNFTGQIPSEMQTRGFFKKPSMINCFRQLPTHYVHYEEMRVKLRKMPQDIVCLWVNSFDEARRTPLMCMAALDNLEGVSFLLEHGADVAIVDYENRSALFYGALFSSIPVLKRLLEAGALLTQNAIGHITPLMVAQRYGRQEVVDLFQEHQRRTDEYLMFRRFVQNAKAESRPNTLETSLQALTLTTTPVPKPKNS